MENGGSLVVDQFVMERIISFRQRLPSMPEAGGLLIGSYKGDNLHITDITTPQPKDESGRYFFNRRDLSHVNKMKELHKSSGGALNFLGEWHTHPEQHPTPSSIDTNGWKKIIRKKAGDRAVFIIAGTHSNWAGTVLA